jgi:hypothetical protein
MNGQAVRRARFRPYELLVLAVIGLAKVVGLWHQAGRALAVLPRRR